MRKTISFTSVVAASLIACGGGNSSSNVDAKGSGSGSGSNSSCTFSGTTTLPGYNTQNSEAIYFPAGSDGPAEILFRGQLGTQNAFEIILNAGGTDWPTTFGPKSNIDLATSQDAGVATLGDPNQTTMEYTTIYVATAGTINVTSAGSANASFAASISGVTLTHYDNILSGSAQPAPDADGCTTMIGSASVTATEMLGSGFEGAGLQRADNVLLHRRSY